MCEMIYLDWNIYAYIRDKNYKNKSHDFDNLLEQIEKSINDNKFETIFSDAHILDILPIEGESVLYHHDMNILTDISKNSYLFHDAIGTNFYKQISDPKEVLEYLQVNHWPLINYENIFKSMGSLRDLMKLMYQSIKSPIPNEIEGKPPKNDTFLHVFEYFITENNSTLKDPKKYRGKRNNNFDKVQEFSSIKNDLDSNNLELFSKFYVEIRPSFSIMFKSIFDEIQLLFLLLDQIKYGTDKRQRNVQIDAMHTAYAAICSCKFLISKDKNMLKKAKIVYNILGIDTIPVNLDDIEGLF